MEIASGSRPRNDNLLAVRPANPRLLLGIPIEAACRAFGCIPYFAIIVDAGETIRGYVLSLQHLLEICSKGKLTCNWKMKTGDLARYQQDPEINTTSHSNRELSGEGNLLGSGAGLGRFGDDRFLDTGRLQPHGVI